MGQASFFDDRDDGQEAAERAAGETCRVVVPYPVDKPYTYRLPDGMRAAAGQYVYVPLGPRNVPGVVWDEAADEEKPPAKKLKDVAEVLADVPPMPSVYRRFVEKVAAYNLAPLGFVLKMALPEFGALEPPGTVILYKPAADLDENLSLPPKQQAVLDAARRNPPMRQTALAEAAGCTPGVVKTLAEKGVLETVERAPLPPCLSPDPARQSVTLSDAQAEAAAELSDAVKAQAFSALLLDGVTGAGKTEVYFEAVAAALAQGKQILILLPEIALSNAFLDRFKARFGVAPALWHSALAQGQRKSTWRGIADGRTKVVVGARSALFLPYADLGLIIVDEEHDPAYKQEDNVIYHARDMAVMRAHMGGFPVVLVSATPSLETMMNCWQERYRHITLPDRFGGARLPDMHLIDMREETLEKQHFIAPTVIEAVAEALARGEQSLLFLNRRGYAPLTLCRTCGHRMECPRCTAWLVEHKRTGRLHCHHCGLAMAVPKHCPECEDEDSLAVCGPGVERVHEEIKKRFPDARTCILASDMAADQDALKVLLTAIRDHEYDIIIGTQIIAKGHHFPNLTLVGVIDADLGLQGGDLRAAERTYQLLHQVAGRAGRADKAGHVYLQSWIPGHKVMQALAHAGRDAFLEVEAGEREAAFMPPFSRLAGIIVSGREEAAVTETAQSLARIMPQAEGVRILGPAEAPLYRLRGHYRRRFLVQADKKLDLQGFLKQWVGAVKPPSSVRIYTDIDPQSFL